MAQKVTLADVSREAGVGIATVSRAMGDHKDVSPATRDRIRAVARQLGYRPSAAARALRRGGFHVISVIVPDNAWGWWEPVVRSAFETASAAGYQVLVHPVAGADGGLTAVIEGLSNIPTEGVIVISAPDQKAVREACDRIGIPGIAIDDSSHDIYFPSISAANYSGAADVTRHLLSLGRSRIAFLRTPAAGETNSTPDGELYIREREQAYRDVQAEAGIPIDEKLILETVYDEAVQGCPELGQLLEANQSIDALFCAFDGLAAPALRELAARGLRVPEDVAVVGFDDERAALLVSPQLTTVRQPYAEMGRASVELLLQSLAGERPDLKRYEFATQLIERASTRSQPLSDSKRFTRR
jgi:LacI family transcriptional regulator